MTSSVSVIIPAYGYCPHLTGAVSAFLSGTVCPKEIIVCHSGSDVPELDLVASSPAVRLLHVDERLFAGAARNRGAGVASGEWLAFADADVWARATWLEAMIVKASKEPESFVVGSVGVASSGGYWGLCNWICEFSEQFPWRASRCQTGGASCSMFVRAADFWAAGGFPESHQGAEDTLLFGRLRGLGRRQWFEPAAQVDHYNHPGILVFARHQFNLGYHSALVRQELRLRGSMATRIWPLVFVLWLPRLLLIGVRVAAGGPRWWLRAVGLAPGVLLGTWIWTAGFIRQIFASKSPIATPKRLTS